MNRTFIDDLARQFGDALPGGMTDLKGDLERQWRAILQAQFAKLDLVTREEFDVQSGVLARTREKVEALERRVAMLEKLALDKPDT
ncbi:MAG: accessory factor UbiK family protein [Gammaproteobacteria bacterium]|nr:accessory factor UbiK family protein [Gammaproteobacteria bacterium]